MANNNPPNANQASVRLYKRIALTFIGLTLVLLGVVVAATLGRATITVTAKSVPVNADIKVSIAPDIKTGETVRGAVLTAVVSGEKDVKPAGQGKVVKGKASGTVMLVNKRNAAQQLVATTRLLTKDGVLFRLKNTVSIPAAGELKDVPVYADKEGAASEIGPSNFTIPGLPAELQKLVYAVSEAPMTGGVATNSVVSQDDIDKAISDLTDELTQKASAQLGTQVAGKGFEGSSVSIVENARSVSAKAGDTVSSFTVLMKLTATGVYYDKAKFMNIGLSSLRDNLPADMDLGSDNMSVVKVAVQNVDPNAGTATLDASFSGEAVITEGSAVLDKSRVVGLDAETIRAYLKSYDSVADVSVKMSPFWVKKAPTMKDHITIIVK